MKRNIKDLIKQMTLEEKASLCSGKDFWRTKPIERLGIPSVMVSDGPAGLRKQDTGGDHLGVNDSIKAVCFPSGCLTACSFDRDLLKTEGEIIGDECQAEDVSVILGPALNIKRSPLGGRNFEYISEDPYLAGEIGSSYVKGVQSKNIGTSVKHFAVNSQEFRRMSVSAEVDERTLREIYFPAFEKTVKEGNPDTIMCSYNRVNGVFSAENKWLLTDVLRKEWGFSGYVVSDWGAVNHRVDGVESGLDLEMPYSGGGTDALIVEAVKKGKLKESVLDKTVERLLKIVFKYTDNRQQGNFDKQAHHEKSAQIAQESFVLLKNEKNILSLSKKDCDKILFVGPFAQKPRYEGGGSSHINSYQVTSALDYAKKQGLKIKYVKGFDINGKTKPALVKEALEEAKKAKKVVIFAGLPDVYESEGFDRKHLNLPENQNELIHAITKVQKNTVVVLHNGSAIEMPWENKVRGILECYLGGDAVGIAQIRVLFGDVNPSGKLAETFPIKLEDTPCYIDFPGDGKTVKYSEGIFVGYRYYDKKNADVLFPFGFGLSYTQFKYSNLKLSSKNIKDTDTLTVTVDVKNVGKTTGKEIVQLYVSDKTNAALRPEKELKGFEKVELKKGETKTVSFTLDKRSFAWYNTNIHDWFAATGDYEILIGSSSRDIQLTGKVHLTTTSKDYFIVNENTVLQELTSNPITNKIIEPLIKKYLVVMGPSESSGESAKETISNEMLVAMMENMPLRALRSFMHLKEEEIKSLIDSLNQALSDN